MNFSLSQRKLKKSCVLFKRIDQFILQVVLLLFMLFDQILNIILRIFIFQLLFFNDHHLHAHLLSKMGEARRMSFDEKSFCFYFLINKSLDMNVFRD